MQTQQARFSDKLDQQTFHDFAIIDVFRRRCRTAEVRRQRVQEIDDPGVHFEDESVGWCRVRDGMLEIVVCN